MNTASTLTPAEITEAYSDIGVKKASTPAYKLISLGILAGFIVGFGSLSTTTAMYALENDSIARLVCGLLFPFALAIVMLIGAELFTGNTMIIISVLDKKTSAAQMLRNWFFVYLGNLIGSALLAALCVAGGQLGRSNGALAAYAIKTAAAKCSLSFSSAVILGILCNLLVCLGVLCSLSAKDTAGRILGAYLPVAFFAVSGFEHCVANMYYIPAGLFALLNPAYAQKALEAGVDVSRLTWGNFFAANLLPVTLGNIIGGMAIALVMWLCYGKSALNNNKADSQYAYKK